MISLQHVADSWAASLVDQLTATTTTTSHFSEIATGHPVGSLTVYEGQAPGGQRVRVVDSRLALPALGIDSVMLHAFAPGSTSSPHLLSDLAGLTADDVTEWHFHVDLMPRVDLVTNTEYLDAVYGPLTDTQALVSAIAGARPIPIPPRLRSMASGWLIGQILRPSDVDVIGTAFTTYMNRWHELLLEPLPVSLSPQALEARDRAHRAATFDPATDIVWDFLADLIGRDAVDSILQAIRGEDSVPPPGS